MRDDNADGDGGLGGILVAGGAFGLVLGGVYQVTQADQSDKATPYIAGIVAITVALITWFATDRRQAKALVVEAARLQHQLDAEAHRHRQRLKHERQLANLDDVRKVMDATFESSDALHDAASRILDAVTDVRADRAVR